MPPTPKYYRQVSLPGRLGAPKAPIQPFTADEAAAGRLGEVIQATGLLMQKRFDESKVTAGYNDFRDIARKKLSELLTLKGEQATGLQEQYDQWYNEFFNDYHNTRLTSGTQQREWGKLVGSRRSSDLDILARHEALEMRAFAEQAEGGMFSSTMLDVTATPFVDTQREQAISDFLERVDKNRPGEDTTALKDKYEAQLRIGALQAMINDDPLRAGAYLDEWKNAIGPKQYKTFKEQLKKKASNQKVDNAYAKMQQVYGVSTDGMLKAIDYLSVAKNYRKEGLTLDESKSTRDKLWTVYQRKTAVQEHQRTKLGEAELNEFSNKMYVENDPEGAFETVRDARYMPAGTRNALLSDMKGDPYDSDLPSLFKLKFKVNTDPESMDQFKIWEWAKVNGNDKQLVQQRWEAIMRAKATDPEKYEVYKRMQSMISSLEFPGETDAEMVTNRLRAANTMEEWFLTKGKEATFKEIEATFHEVIKDARDNTWGELFTNLFTFGTPHPTSPGKRQPFRAEALRLLLRQGVTPSEKKTEEYMKILTEAEHDPTDHEKVAKALLLRAGKPRTAKNIKEIIKRLRAQPGE